MVKKGSAHMKHEIIQDLEQRYTAKKYDATRKISQENLLVLLEALRLSASSINAQPWKFIVIESDTAKQRLHDLFDNSYQFNQPHIKAASHVILFAHKMTYTPEDYTVVIEQGIVDKRVPESQKEAAFGAYGFAEKHKDAQGQHHAWTKAQTYIALGNALHTLARLKIDSTTMEGIDSQLLSDAFSAELEGYECHVALAIGYHHPSEDYNLALPKSRKPFEQVIQIL